MKNKVNISKTTDIIKVLLVENDKSKISEFTSALDQSNYHISQVSTSGMSLLREVNAFEPDMIIIDIESPDRDMLDSLNRISKSAPKPVVMFSDREDTDLINALVKSGVTAYVAGEVNPSRVKSILDTAIARFTEYQQLKKELEVTKQKLTNHRVVEQAKLWLMKTKNHSEEQAYQSIRKMAMDNSQKIEDVAKNILSLASMLEMSS
ncbi:MAG: ANTAR domain-containing protein [Colwelliaceae bacterium]|jgi:response regulator NasT|nr:ANTAR domain-containing protein [Colwelliaceae bacterium]